MTPALFVGHGVPAFTADPDDATHRWLRRFGPTLRASSPRGVLCVSAHFTAARVTVTSAEAPATLHDHGHVPLQDVVYPAPGSPAIARRALELLLHAGLDVASDPARGLDHGAWLPLSLLFPEQDLPVVELSLQAAHDPELHLTIGRALEPLRREGILLVGSGGVTQDLVDLERRVGAAADDEPLAEPSRRFDAWVTDIVTRSPPYARSRGLARFRDHEHARRVHATDEHFLPLLVIAGAASMDHRKENVAELVHAGSQRGLSRSAFLFGG